MENLELLEFLSIREMNSLKFLELYNTKVLKDSDIYISIFGKKIYLKKAIKDFEQYDKIEKSGKIFNKVLYYERVEKEINLSQDEAIENSVKELENSLLNDLNRDAKIVDKLIDNEMQDEENLLVKVVFVVEQNIVSEETVGY